MKTTVIIFLLYYVVNCVNVSQPPNHGMCNITFDPNNFTVHFSTWVRQGDKYNEYGVDDLIPIIKTISTRFLTIDSAYINSGSKSSGSSTIHIPIAVAKFNSDHASFMGQRSLKLRLSWGVTENENSRGNQYSTFTYTVELANKANLIFPGTVRTILLEAFYLTENNAEQMKNQIAYAKSVITKDTLPYELGCTLDITSCEITDRWLHNLMNRVIIQLDYIFIIITPGKEYSGYGADIAHEKIVERFEKCKRQLRWLKSALKVGLRTSWQDIDSHGNQNISNLVRYWENMNNYARSTDTTVIMLEAFDQPFRRKTNDHAHIGWWKLNESMTYRNSEAYIFDEKCTSMKTETSGIISPKKQIPPEDNPTTISTHEAVVNTKLSVNESNDDEIGPTKNPENGFGKIEIGATTTVFVFGLLILIIFNVCWKLRTYKTTIRVPDAEIEEFFKGREGASTDNTVDSQVNKAYTLAYDNNYEITSGSFKLDESVPLGSGEFGYVCLGKVQTASMEIQTAVKIAKSNTAVALKSLMCEIKVLSFIGVHDNIVRFVGAYTAQLHNGTLMLFLELCPNGSLLKYLRRYGDTISREVVNHLNLTGEDNGDNLDASNVVNMQIMLKWCRDILSGMGYLASKNLIHADLATRNVLLDRDRRAKICDFGLSRRLYDYSSYVKSNSEPLPWRWMSPESLRRMEFNEKSDVWAFGVTVWEIFSFGDVPYPGLSWTNDFAMSLEAGLCLQNPLNCPPDLYEKMLRCWIISPMSRPTFSQLATEFAGYVGN